MLEILIVSGNVNGYWWSWASNTSMVVYETNDCSGEQNTSLFDYERNFNSERKSEREQYWPTMSYATCCGATAHAHG